MARKLSLRKIRSKGAASIIALLFAAISGAYFYGSNPANTSNQLINNNQPGLYSVERFSDGDTISVNMNGKTEKVRMIGIDTPETHKPNSPVQCYGPAASSYTKRLIGSNKVRLEADPENTNRDRYDRLLRYVYLPDGQFVNKKIVSEGYGFAYMQFPFSKIDEFAEAQEQAKAANKGLWGNCQPYQQDSGRWQTNNQS